MKKYLALFLMLLMLCVACTAIAAEPTFEVGEDETEYFVENASGWNVTTAYVKIAAGDDVLYNGSVTLTSDTMLASEFTYAAIVEAGCGADGALEGFVNSIGDYVSGTDANGNYVYWGYSVNGKNVPFACNQLTIQPGDYIMWTFGVYDPEAGFGAEPLPTGFDAPFEVGEDETEYVVDGSSGWTMGTVNVKIVAGEDVLYNGTVTLTSDNMFVSEATMAAVYEAGCGGQGFESGFVEYIGDYVNATAIGDKSYYWSYSVNGKGMAPVAANQFRLLDGDFIIWEFLGY